MGADRAQQDMKKFLSKILIEGLTEENYIDLKFRLKKYDDNNIYLIYLLNILGINSQMLDLIIKQYELKIKGLFQFLSPPSEPQTKQQKMMIFCGFDSF